MFLSSINENMLVGMVFLFVALSGLPETFLGDLILGKLRDTDHVYNRVAPHPYGIVTLSWIQLGFTFFLILSIVCKSFALITFFLLTSVAHGIHLLKILSTGVSYDGQCIRYHSLGRVRLIEPYMIRKIKWEERSRTFGCTLVLYLYDGKEITLAEGYYRGLSNLYKNFSYCNGRD